MSYCGYFINRGVAPARVAISVLPVLIITTLRNGIFGQLPRISYAIWLTDMLFVSLVFANVSVLQFAVVCWLLERLDAAKGRLAVRPTPRSNSAVVVVVSNATLPACPPCGVARSFAGEKLFSAVVCCRDGSFPRLRDRS